MSAPVTQPAQAQAQAQATQNATNIANSAANLATPSQAQPQLASPESKAKAIVHLTELGKKLQPIIGKPGYNVFVKLTPAFTRMAAPDCTVDEVNAAMKLDDKKETYAVAKPQPFVNSASPMVQAMVEGAGPVATLASMMG